MILKHLTKVVLTRCNVMNCSVTRARCLGDCELIVCAGNTGRYVLRSTKSWYRWLMGVLPLAAVSFT